MKALFIFLSSFFLLFLFSFLFSFSFSFFPVFIYTSSAQELIHFENIKKDLKNDVLEEEAKKKLELKEKKVKEEAERKRKNFNIPEEAQFLNFFSEYFLVKNEKKLLWGAEFPDLDLKKRLDYYLDEFAFKNKVKILLSGSKDLTHAYLPLSNNEIVILLSFPFMRALNLSTEDVALLLLEDLVRANLNFFSRHVSLDSVKGLGENFYGKKLEGAAFDLLLKNYNSFIFEKGYSIEDQYELTIQMKKLFEKKDIYWNRYLEILKRLDNLVKSDPVFGPVYLRVYPTPELQLKLSGKK